MSGLTKSILVLGAAISLFIAIQLIPYGRTHDNPPAANVVTWDSPRTLELARRACFDCHSNETRWPWYASIAPISWRIQTHVNEGREKLNFSSFDPGLERVADAAGEAGETVQKGKMPPNDYLLMHPEARLSVADRRVLANGLDATFGRYVGGQESLGENCSR